jgi:hypothetical protein
MNSQKILRYSLFAFLVVAAVFIATKEIRQSGSATASDGGLPADGLAAVYFHGAVRCPTCQTIETYAKEAIDTRFEDELANGKLSWLALNYELPENLHFAREYGIVAPTVVLVRREAGSDVEAENLARVWELVGDKPAFVEYIAAETKSVLATD